MFGSPKNRVIEDRADYHIAVDFFAELGEYAKENGTCIAVEANPSMYGTNFINTTDEAVAFVKDVQSGGVKINLDFGTIIVNDEDIMQISSYLALVNHVHISEPWLNSIEKREQHQALFEICEKERYDGYISIEMKRHAVSAVQDAMLYISEIYRQFEGVCYG